MKQLNNFAIQTVFTGQLKKIIFCLNLYMILYFIEKQIVRN